MEKGENAGNQHFLLFPTMFSILSQTEFIILVISSLSSAEAFNLVQSKILSFGKKLYSLQQNFGLIHTMKDIVDDGLNVFHTKIRAFELVENIVGKRRKMYL